MASPASGYLGTPFPAPTDPSYYLAQTGTQGPSGPPAAFNADTFSALFAPQGMQNTPVNNMATNPFLQLFMNSAMKNLGDSRPKLNPSFDDLAQQGNARSGPEL